MRTNSLPRLKRIRYAHKSYNPNWSELNDTDYDDARNSEWEILDQNIPTDEYILGSKYRHKVRNPHLLRVNTTNNKYIPKIRRSSSLPKLKRQHSSISYPYKPNLEMIKKNKLIPNDYSLEDYHELIISINKYKKKIQNKKYNKKTNIRSTEEYKINAREFSRLKYIENKPKHNKYCRLYFKTTNEIKEHNVKYNYTLIQIKKLDIQNTKTIRGNLK